MQKPEGHHAQAARRDSKEQQWNRRDDAGAEHQQGRREIAVPESAFVMRRFPQEQPGRDRSQQGGFHRKAQHRAQRRLLPQQSVESKAGGESERDPGEVPQSPDQQTDSRRRYGHRRPLERTEGFAEDHPPENDVEDRDQKVAEAALDDLTGLNAPDIDQPIHGEQGRAHQVDPPIPWGSQRGPEGRPLSAGDEDREQESEGPDVPVGDQLDRVDRSQQAPEQGYDTPEEVASGRSEDPLGGQGERGGGRSVRRE